MKHVKLTDYWTEEIAEVREACQDLISCPTRPNLDHLAMEVFDAMGSALLVANTETSLRRARFAISQIVGDFIFVYIMRNPSLFWDWLRIKEAKGYPSDVPWKQTLRLYMTGI